VANLSTYKPHFSDVVRSIVDSMMLDMYFCLPAKIVKYNKATQYADVQIQLYERFNDGTLKLPPVIPMVPVKHPRARGGECFIHMPLVPGDDVTLVFSQRSLDVWKSQGGASDPGDPRKNHITDAYALIGGSAIPDAFTPATDDALEIVNGEATIQVFPGGTFKISNGTNELISLLQEALSTLAGDTTNTGIGPQPLNAFSTYSELAGKVATLQGES
jgi:hypothetical protein